MLGYEFFKNKAVFLLLALLLVGKCVISSRTYAWKDTPYNRIYLQYVTEIGGEYSAEKAEYIEKEYREQSIIVRNSEKMEKDFLAGIIGIDEYEAYLQAFSAAQVKVSVLLDLKEQSSHLERLYTEKGVLGSYIFPVGLETYLYQGADWLLMIFICVLCCNTFIIEFGKTSSRGAVISLLQSTPRGRASLYKTKLCLIVAAVTVVYWTFFIIDYVNLSSDWLLPNASDLLVSYRTFKKAPISFTFGGYFALTACVGFLGALMISLTCVSVAQMTKEPVFVYVICATILIVPHFTESVGVEVCGYFNFTNLVNTNELFLMSNKLQWMGSFGWLTVFTVSCTLLTGILVLLSAKQIQKGLKG